MKERFVSLYCFTLTFFFRVPNLFDCIFIAKGYLARKFYVSLYTMLSYIFLYDLRFFFCSSWLLNMSTNKIAFSIIFRQHMFQYLEYGRSLVLHTLYTVVHLHCKWYYDDGNRLFPIHSVSIQPYEIPFFNYFDSIIGGYDLKKI